MAYTEERDSKNLIKTNTKTYLTHLVKSGAEVGQSEYDKEKAKTQEAHSRETHTEAQKVRLKELETEYLAERSREALKALTLDTRHAQAMAWAETEEGQGRAGDYDRTKGDFKDVVNRARFSGYLRKVVHQPYTPEDFKTWLKVTKKLDPAKLGLEG